MSVKNIIEKIPDAGRQNRLQAADYFLNHTDETEHLLQLAFNPKYSYHHKAAWVVEFVAFKQPDLIIQHFDFFINSLALLKKDSSVRPIAKTTYLFVQKHLYESPDKLVFRLNSTQIQQIITAAFDWLIGP